MEVQFHVQQYISVDWLFNIGNRYDKQQQQQNDVDWIANSMYLQLSKTTPQFNVFS